MKCPECKFVCSDLRDICPRCFVDMRPFKSALGIQVSSPKASYEDLLKKLGVQTEQPPREQGSLWGRLFRREAAPAAQPTQETKPPPAAPVTKAAEPEALKVQTPQPQRTTARTMEPGDEEGIPVSAPPRAAEESPVSEPVHTKLEVREERPVEAAAEAPNPAIMGHAPVKEAPPGPGFPEEEEDARAQLSEVRPPTPPPPEPISAATEPVELPPPSIAAGNADVHAPVSEAQPVAPPPLPPADSAGNELPEPPSWRERRPPRLLVLERPFRKAEPPPPPPPPHPEPVLPEEHLVVEPAVNPPSYNFPQRLEAAREDIRQLRLQTLADSEAPLDEYIDVLITKVLERVQAMSAAAAPVEEKPDISEADVSELIEKSLTAEPDIDAETAAVTGEEGIEREPEAQEPEPLLQTEMEEPDIPEAGVSELIEKSLAAKPDVHAETAAVTGEERVERAPEAQVPEPEERAIGAEPPPLPVKEPPSQPPKAITAQPETVEELFRAALRDTAVNPAPLELSSEVFSREAASEEIVLLFSLAKDAIENPESEKVLQAGILASEQRAVQTPGLTAQLRKVEEVMNAPRITLHGGGAQADEAEIPESKAAPLPPLVRAPAWRRFEAFAVDLLFIVLASAAIAAGWFFTDQGTARIGAFDRIDAIQLAGSFVVSFLLLSLIYPLLSLWVSRATPGLHTARLKLVNIEDRKLALSQATVRTLLQPISLVLFGWVPLLWGGRPLQDWLSCTDVCLREDV